LILDDDSIFASGAAFQPLDTSGFELFALEDVVIDLQGFADHTGNTGRKSNGDDHCGLNFYHLRFSQLARREYSSASASIHAMDDLVLPNSVLHQPLNALATEQMAFIALNHVLLSGAGSAGNSRLCE
jgi:hypothetical protein